MGLPHCVAIFYTLPWFCSTKVIYEKLQCSAVSFDLLSSIKLFISKKIKNNSKSKLGLRKAEMLLIFFSNFNFLSRNIFLFSDRFNGNV
jgi:hypothetical protein